MTIWALPLATTELSPRSLTSKILTLGIRSLIDRSDFRPVTNHPVLYPQEELYAASPKTVSERTSYYVYSISFSLLTSAHPKILNNQPVRASLPISREFTLAKASS